MQITTVTQDKLGDTAILTATATAAIPTATHCQVDTSDLRTTRLPITRASGRSRNPSDASRAWPCSGAQENNKCLHPDQCAQHPEHQRRPPLSREGLPGVTRHRAAGGKEQHEAVASEGHDDPPPEDHLRRGVDHSGEVEDPAEQTGRQDDGADPARGIAHSPRPVHGRKPITHRRAAGGGPCAIELRQRGGKTHRGELGREFENPCPALKTVASRSSRGLPAGSESAGAVCTGRAGADGACN